MKFQLSFILVLVNLQNQIFKEHHFQCKEKKVRPALEWLKLNHCDYYDLEISQRNLDQYSEDDPPVVVNYQQSFTNKNPESTAVNDIDDENDYESLCNKESFL